MCAIIGAHFSGKTIYSELTAPTDSPVKFCLPSAASDRAYTKEKRKNYKQKQSRKSFIVYKNNYTSFYTKIQPFFLTFTYQKSFIYVCFFIDKNKKLCYTYLCQQEKGLDIRFVYMYI